MELFRKEFIGDGKELEFVATNIENNTHLGPILDTLREDNVHDTKNNAQYGSNMELFKKEFIGDCKALQVVETNVAYDAVGTAVSLASVPSNPSLFPLIQPHDTTMNVQSRV